VISKPAITELQGQSWSNVRLKTLPDGVPLPSGGGAQKLTTSSGNSVPSFINKSSYTFELSYTQTHRYTDIQNKNMISITKLLEVGLLIRQLLKQTSLVLAGLAAPGDVSSSPLDSFLLPLHVFPPPALLLPLVPFPTPTPLFDVVLPVTFLLPSCTNNNQPSY